MNSSDALEVPDTDIDLDEEKDEDSSTSRLKKKTDDEILEEIRDFLSEAQNYWNPIYAKGREDKEFVTIDGAQWDAIAKKERDEDNLPSLEINLARTYCRQQINTQRQNRPQIQPVPVDSAADIETAKTLKGLVKDTEVVSDAESAYDAAAENAVYGGMGFIRVITDYVSEDSFEQEPRIVAVHNTESVYIDPMSKALDGSDNTRALVKSWVDREQLIKEHGDDAVRDFDTDLSDMLSWYNQSDKKVLVAEYFTLDQEEKELCLLGDGTTKWKSDVIAGEHVIKTRKSAKKVINWYKVSGNKVLDRTIFVGQLIPVVPVYGEVTWIGEDRHVFSLVHFAKDPARLFNYWKSTEAHQLSEMSDAPYVAAVEQIAGYEEEWKHPKGLRVLHYNYKDDQTGQQLPPPQRVGFPGSPSGVLNAAMGAQQSIVDVLNMHAPAMGSSQSDQSGVAIGKLQTQQETSNFHFPDNLNKSIAQIGRILIPQYQAFYTEEHIKRIIGDDGKPQTVTLNQPMQPNQPLQKGQTLSKNGWLNDLTVGRYDVRMQTGANYNTQRQETASVLQQLVRADPSLMQKAGDLILRSLDGVGIAEIADRVERSIPPQLKNDPNAPGPNGQPPLPPEVQQHIQQADATVQQLQQQLGQLQAAVTDKQAERNHKAQLAEMDAQVKLAIAQMNNESKENLNELTNAVKLMLQHMQVPPALAAEVDQQLMQPDPNQGVNPNPYQDSHLSPQQAGFFMPEQGQAPMPESMQNMPHPFALDDGQIESSAHPMAAAANASLPAPDGLSGH